MEKDYKVELLAPAGSPEGFYGAVHAGADAVYLAGDRFGARAYAENFTDRELTECIRYGHMLGRKIYLTVNTLLKEEEMDGLYAYLVPFYEAGLDAVIVQDLGVLRFVRTYFPGLDIHVSTQMAVTGSGGALLLKKMGVKRIIPARELSLAELCSMKRQTGLEIETFIHGAMCYCYSGQCLFSSILGGRSGNRGRCAQPCRLPYSIGTGRGKECYPLSLKDMCTIDQIPALIQAGIDSFKIEGRMKKPEYAAGVTDVYRRYIDYYYELREKMGVQEADRAYRVKKEDRNCLGSLYIRSGVESGYYFRRNGGEMVTMDSPAYSKTDEALLATIREKHLDAPLKIPVEAAAYFHVGMPARVVLQWGECRCEVTGQEVEPASRQPISADNVRKQLGKLGESCFYAERITVELDGNSFYPLKQINELRREAVAALEQEILSFRGYGVPGKALSAREGTGEPCREEGGREQNLNGEGPGPKETCPQKGFVLSVSSVRQLQTVAEWISCQDAGEAMRFYVDGDLLVKSWAEAKPYCRQLSSRGRIYAALPVILRESDREYLEKLYALAAESGMFSGFLARSMEGAGFLDGKGRAFVCRLDAGIYVWNKWAMAEAASFGDGFCLPWELKASEQKGLPDPRPAEKIVYGRIPMMITANCLFRTGGQCRRKTGDRHITVLKDRLRKEFPVMADCLHCTNVIYNSVPLSLHQELDRWRGRADLRMDFTLETGEEVRAVLDTFFHNAPFPMKEYTTGHERRGVL